MPSTTIIAQPPVMMPAYNPIKYIIDNTNKNEPGFRYIFTIYPAGSATQIAQYRVLPIFSTGYGEQDISRLMQSLVTYNESGIDDEVPYNSSESWYQYDIDLGYEFIDNIDYITTLQDNGGNVRISFTAHGFVAGDQVVIVQADGGVANPALEGLHTVLSATANQFTVNVLWSTIGDDTINGNVTYADLRKTQVLDDEAIVDQEVFNGAYNNNINTSNEAVPFNSGYYLGLANPSGYLMTSNLPTNVSAAPSAFDGAQFYYNLRVYGAYNYEIEWYDMDGNLLDTYPFSPANDGIYAVFVGPTAAVTVDYYVSIFSDGPTANSFYYFKYDNRCTINDQQLIYLDRMGSWQSFAFQLRTYEKGQITREQYNQHIDGQVVSAEWVGVPLQKGFTTYNTNVTKTFDLNTNWMDQYDATRFQELLTSPQVYYFSNDYYCACVVDSSSFEVFSQKNKKLIKQSVTIRLAQQDPING
jgi:hypothetical protein